MSIKENKTKEEEIKRIVCMKRDKEKFIRQKIAKIRKK
jgi:hypothetical protein